MGQALTRLQWVLGSRHVTTERERLGQGAEGSGGPQLRDRQELQAREGHGCGGGGSNGGDDDGDFAVMVG